MRKACITSDNNMLNLTIVVLRTRNGSNLEYMLPYRLQTNHYIHQRTIATSIFKIQKLVTSHRGNYLLVKHELDQE